MAEPSRLAVLLSGSGTTLQNLIDLAKANHAGDWAERLFCHEPAVVGGVGDDPRIDEVEAAGADGELTDYRLSLQAAGRAIRKGEARGARLFTPPESPSQKPSLLY